MASSASLGPLSFSIFLEIEGGSADVSVYNLSSLPLLQRESFVQNLTTGSALVPCQEVFSKTLCPGKTEPVRTLSLGTDFLLKVKFRDNTLLTQQCSREELNLSSLKVSSAGVSFFRDQSANPNTNLRRVNSAGALDGAFAHSPLVTSSVVFGVSLDSNGQPVPNEALEALLNEAMNEHSESAYECSRSIDSVASGESDVEEVEEGAKEETSSEESIMGGSGGFLDEIMKNLGNVGYNKPEDQVIVDIPSSNEEVSPDGEEIAKPLVPVSSSELPGLSRNDSVELPHLDSYPYDDLKSI